MLQVFLISSLDRGELLVSHCCNFARQNSPAYLVEGLRLGDDGEEQNLCYNRKPELKAEPLFRNHAMRLQVIVVEPILIPHETTQTDQ